ncbi:hypothetical protein ACF08N_27640 [Streptomyces sp. NPDC015127]
MLTINLGVLLAITVVVRLRRRTEARSRFDVGAELRCGRRARP